MLLNVPYSRVDASLTAFISWRKSTNRRLSPSPNPIIVALVFATLGLCSFMSRAESKFLSHDLETAAPIALNDVIAGIEDTPMTIVGITANDVDTDGMIDVTTIDLDPNQAGQQTTMMNIHGTYSLSAANGEITYVPTPDWNGTTSLAYTVNDDEGNTSNIAYIYITLDSVIDAPVAMDDFATGFEDDAYINISMVQNNDFDPEGQGFIVGSIDIDPLTLTQDTYYEDASGVWMVDLGYGTISFFPNPNFQGTAMIGYTIVSFTNMLSNVAMVFVEVAPTNDAPVAEPNSIVVNSGSVAVLPQITANDSDLENNIQINTIDLDPSLGGQQTTTTTIHGSWQVDLLTGDVTFTAIGGYSGSTSIMYTVSDSLGLTSNLAALTAHMIGTNAAPTAMGDAVTGLEDSPFINIPNVAANDTDPNGNDQILIASIDLETVTPGQQTSTTNVYGAWSVDTITGTVTYIPAPNFNGNAGVWYSIKDVGGLESAPGHIVVTVTPDDDNPIAGADSAQTHVNLACYINNILDNDFDMETTLDPASVDLNLESPGVQHTFTNLAGQWDYIVVDEKVLYTPATGFLGTAEHEYVVMDDDGSRSLPASLNVEVMPAIPINATPIPYQSQFMSYSSMENTQVASDSWSSTWVDYNNDGWDDLFVSDKSSAGANYMFQNLMGTGFEETESSIFATSTTSVGSLWADYDNDGDQDVIIINDGLVPSQMFHNNGNGSFTVVNNSGISTSPQYIHGASCVDYDNDGYLDVFMSNYHQSRTHELYHNDGDGTFTKINGTPLTEGTHRSVGPVWCDYDNDGYQDLFVPNSDNQNNSLYHNNGDGTFENVTTGPVVNDGGQSVGACWGDYDRDGDMDLFVANASNQNNFFYTNNGDGTFTKITNSIIVQEGGHSHGCSWIDIDNDADLDLYVSNDQGYKFLYINDGTGQFFRKLNEPIVDQFGNAFGQSWSDIDHDGDLDLYVSTHGQEPNRMFINGGSNYNYIDISLQGTNSNRNAIGAAVSILTNGIWQTSQVSAQCGFNGQHSQQLHFGIGSATVIDSISVIWPSGLHQTLTNQNVNQQLAIIESSVATLSGIAFYDANFNCTRDEGEQTISNMHITINETEHNIQTDANGAYTIPLSSNVYSIDGTNSSYWQNECPAEELTIIDEGNQYTVDVPFTPSVYGYDLAVSVVGLGWATNTAQSTTITYQNIGTVDAESTHLTVIYPEGVSIIDASIPWTYVDGQTYVWDLGTVPFGSSTTITLIDAVGNSPQPGDILRVTAAIHASGQDLAGHNNFAYFDREIIENTSPNTIRVLPRGEGSLGYIESDQELQYTIQFQNSGSQIARHLRIENTLPPNLDIQTFEIVAASNMYSYVITDERHLTIFFENINLTTAAISNLESQGVIMYKIRPIANANAGEAIENRATLYFDYESPIATNDVQNTLRGQFEGDETQVMLWPNPTNGIIHIGLNTSQIQFDDRPSLSRVEITDAKGQIVKSWTDVSAHQLDFNTLELRAGGYHVRIIGQDGTVHSGRFIVTNEKDK
jgi:hypothetical protein